MMGSMRALAAVVQQASTKHFVGSGVLNLLQSQVDSCFGHKIFRVCFCAQTSFLIICPNLEDCHA